MVVSDHSPCVSELKRLTEGDFLGAWGGIGGVGYTLSVVWTEAVRRGIGLDRVVEWVCRAPAKHAGLEGMKGCLAPGCDADVVLWDPEAKYEVSRTRARLVPSFLMPNLPPHMIDQGRGHGIQEQGLPVSGHAGPGQGGEDHPSGKGNLPGGTRTWAGHRKGDLFQELSRT